MIDIHSTLINLGKSYKRNKPEMIALTRREYPDFVFQREINTLQNEIPVFTFHSVEPLRFERQMRYLAKNGYETLDTEDIYKCLTGERRIPERSVCLTFDDGWGSVWAVAYPLLKKYGMKAVCFLVAGMIDGRGEKYPNLEDVVEKKADLKEVLNRETSPRPLCTWGEIEIMHESGIVDFQSHGLYHSLIFTSGRIVDFINPRYDFFKKNFNVPLIRENGVDKISRETDWGSPIYEYDSRLSGKRRYFDDGRLRGVCTDYVARRGRVGFFKSADWRRQLRKVVNRYRERIKTEQIYESEAEMEENIFLELRQSKIIIENNLSNKSVRHFCFPWWVGSSLATKISQEAGYLSNYWGIIPERRTRNRIGDDPYKIGRFLSDEYIYRLPGEGRISFVEVLQEKGRVGFRTLLGKLSGPREYRNV